MGSRSSFIVPQAKQANGDRRSLGVGKGAVLVIGWSWATGHGTLRPEGLYKVRLHRVDGLTSLSLEEPYAGNLLVRVCGGAGGQTSGATRLFSAENPESYFNDASRPAQSIKTAWIIRPLRITEIRRASGESVSTHCNPDAIG